MNVHPTAIVDDGAELGENVTVGPFSYLQDKVIVGNGTVIGPHATILAHTTLGHNCSVHAGATLGGTPQDVGFEGVESYVKIGAHCIIREGVTIHRGTKANTTTEIGDNCFLMAFSHFAHNVRLGHGVIVANGALCGGYVEIGDQAFISGNCTIHQFVRIGSLAMLSGNSAASKDVPPFCMTRPVSLNTVVGVNVVGMRRAGMDSKDRREVKNAFSILYRSGLTVSEAVKKMQAECPHGPVLKICDFIRSSRRGICKSQ